MAAVQIKEVQSGERTRVREVVRVHMETFPHFFLTFMGAGFLRQLYSGYCGHPGSGLFVAEDDAGTVLGFLAYSTDMSGFYKTLIKIRLIPFAWYSLLAVFRKPAVFFRLLRAFLKPGESQRAEPYVELASIGVRPDVKESGVGTKLVEALKEQVDFQRFAYITLETDAEENEVANRFYQKNGFQLYRTYETPEKRKMNEYRFYGGDNQ